MLDHERAHVGQDIKDRCSRGDDIGIEEYKQLRLNSYERRYILPTLDDETLDYVVRGCLHHCERHSTATYDGVLQEYLVPELLRRLDVAKTKEVRDAATSP